VTRANARYFCTIIGSHMPPNAEVSQWANAFGTTVMNGGTSRSERRNREGEREDEHITVALERLRLCQRLLVHHAGLAGMRSRLTTAR